MLNLFIHKPIVIGLRSWPSIPNWSKLMECCKSAICGYPEESGCYW